MYCQPLPSATNVCPLVGFVGKLIGGATMALPIWANYMRSLYENPDFGISKDDFLPPEEMSIPVECEKISVNNLNYKMSPKEDLDALGF